MTVRCAERIMGLDVRELPAGDRAERIYGAYDGDVLVAKGSGRGWPTRFAEAEALDGLVETVYRMRCELVAEQQAFRCFNCFHLAPLETDHISARSHGRSDRRANLRALCVPCHVRRHAEPKWVLAPHPKIVDLMNRIGLVWREARGWQALTTSTANEDGSLSTLNRRS